MLQAFRRPAWSQELVVTADAAYASRAHVELIDLDTRPLRDDEMVLSVTVMNASASRNSSPFSQR
jgi:hypothetical protein